jgi:hypothetical protein
MAQLKVKQISDFVTAVANVHNGTAGTQTTSDISTAKSGAISSAYSADVVALSSAKSYADQSEVDAINSAVSQAEAKDVSRAATTATNLSNAVSVEKLRAETAEGLIDGRVTTLLGGSTEALDTFGEIKTFIDGLAAEDVTTIAAISTAVSNDVVHAADILANATAISDLDFSGNFDQIGAAANALSDAKVYADQAEVDAESAAATEAARLDAIVLASAATASEAYADGLAGNYDATGLAAAALSDAKVYADQAEVDAESAAATEAARLDAIVLASAATASESYADQAEIDAVASAATYTDGRETSILSTLRGEISTLAGTDKLEQLAINILENSFSIGAALETVNNDILVFVNGLQIHRSSEGVDGFATADGQAFTVSALGYILEESDHIVVIGVLA